MSFKVPITVLYFAFALLKVKIVILFLKRRERERERESGIACLAVVTSLEILAYSHHHCRIKCQSGKHWHVVVARSKYWPITPDASVVIASQIISSHPQPDLAA